MAEAHVNECLSREEEREESSSDSETYEEYTWCDETRVRATSMLTPQARASKTQQITMEPPNQGDIGRFHSAMEMYAYSHQLSL